MGRAFEYRKAAKMKRWGNMSRIFPKLGKIITMAAKEGGPDPDMNPKLRTAILTAKAQNMPKDNIDAAIKRATGKDAITLLEVNIEGKAPHGALIFVECATDNNTRTVGNVRSYFSKAKGEMLNNGSLEFMFSRKAVFSFPKPEMDLEELEFALIDAGLEELEEDEGEVSVTGDYTAFGALSAALESLGIAPTKAALERIPNTTVEFTDEQMVDIEKLIDRLEEDDDVQAVYTNIG
ncbi:MAG: YebC/PmpR family DNA-binding transcriptional regulator [Sulfuricurvum sp.]|uniref:YebC/PmpR family DNA-binding transcriptional regulator n=2 Tax=Sulfuricurvum TaxID=286130 RepID=UPI002627576E|nr:YebC/PmpR family DNA-binding transcriptional regulator [Sulfuricurvum sp.]MDD2838640.1 YebC/PmpR family DNA-binding transcriptional regulator [Sulfuricurvum sp.]MDD3596627.1 YebC/PmpR family DNA-binding transcriptional regulator [Sulfuricurvum sp.]MDD4882992.1 YebC/PmpR family DNA-binding transcriptional regulator [Sulfuricurvum sp.]